MTDNLYNGSRLTAHGSRLTAHGSRLTAHESDSVQFSIIVPVYNCEKYLNKCLDSLCDQDIFTLTNSRNYEIIIVDDGSTDKSGEICDSYAEKFSFIHVTHTENHGVAHARNIALKQCQGNYIMFSDPDDFVSPQLISVVSRAVELDNQADMFVFKHLVRKSLQDDEFPIYDVDDMKISDWKYPTNEELCLSIILDIKVGGFLWNKVTKKESLQGKYFNENLYLMSDRPYLLDVLCSHKNMRICSMNYYLYCYVQHSDYGQTRLINRIFDQNGMKRYIISMEKEIQINGISQILIEQIKSTMYQYALHDLWKPVVKMSPNTIKKLRQLIKNYAACYYFKYKTSPLTKIKSLIKHILVLLHIHK